MRSTLILAAAALTACATHPLDPPKPAARVVAQATVQATPEPATATPTATPTLRATAQPTPRPTSSPIPKRVTSKTTPAPVRTPILIQLYEDDPPEENLRNKAFSDAVYIVETALLGKDGIELKHQINEIEKRIANQRSQINGMGNTIAQYSQQANELDRAAQETALRPDTTIIQSAPDGYSEVVISSPSNSAQVYATQAGTRRQQAIGAEQQISSALDRIQKDELLLHTLNQEYQSLRRDRLAYLYCYVRIYISEGEQAFVDAHVRQLVHSTPPCDAP